MFPYRIFILFSTKALLYSLDIIQKRKWPSLLMKYMPVDNTMVSKFRIQVDLTI